MPTLHSPESLELLAKNLHPETEYDFDNAPVFPEEEDYSVLGNIIDAVTETAVHAAYRSIILYCFMWFCYSIP